MKRNLCVLTAGILIVGSQVAFAIGDFGPDTCMEGLVWREACGPGDHVCVLPTTREQAQQDNAAAASRVQPGGGPFGPDTCRQGFVWREACGPGDHVCVDPRVRAAAAEDNRRASERKKYPFCIDYANEAVTTAAAAATFGCGFGGPRWNATGEEHFRWCLNNTNETIARERQGRGTQLTACRQGL
jgi:hypothetical protein